MRFTAETTSDGVTERLFTLGDITGALWSPADASGSRPLVLLGHGGGQHKQSSPIVTRAHHYVTAAGFTVAAIDVPGYGERPRLEIDQKLTPAVRRRVASGQPVDPEITRGMAERAAQAVAEWHTTLDALEDLDGIDAGGPVGFWGVSLGSSIGVPFVAAEPRITAAVFGLTSYRSVGEAARRVAIPVEFVLQWDDELVPRESGLAAFDAFASREKTLHANPGPHSATPPFELESSARFFLRHLVRTDNRAGHPG